MNLDLIALMAMLIVMSLYIIGIFLYMIIRWSDISRTPQEKIDDDDDEMKFCSDIKKKYYKYKK